MEEFDRDLVATIQNLKADADVIKALTLVKAQLPEMIELQKELVLIEAPSFHEKQKAKRYAELLQDAGLEDVTMDDHFNVVGRISGIGHTRKSVKVTWIPFSRLVM